MKSIVTEQERKVDFSKPQILRYLEEPQVIILSSGVFDSDKEEFEGSIC